MLNFKISQSIYKKFLSYQDGKLCGLVFQAEIEGRIKSKSSKANKLGLYFEYLATGAKPAYGDPVPEPETYTKNQYDKKKYPEKWEQGYKVGDVKPDWLHPQKQADAFKAYCADLGIEIISVGEKVERDGIRGTLDLKIHVPKRSWAKVMTDDIEYAPEVVCDLKFTDLIGDRRNRLGWHQETFGESPYCIQAKTYRNITGLPFLFWLFSSKTMNSAFFPVRFDQFSLDHLKGEMLAAKKLIEVEKQVGFTPYPLLSICAKCELRKGCEHAATTPTIYPVFAGW